MTEQEDVQIKARKPLSHKMKVNNVVFVIMLISMLPVFVGFGAFEIMDAFDVRELREEGREVEAFMWSLASVVTVFIGVYVCAQITLYCMRHMHGMKESMMSIWEDDDGEEIPEPPEPKPLSKEGLQKLNRIRMAMTILLMACIGLISGVFMVGILDKVHEFFGYDPKADNEDIIAFAMGSLELVIGITVLAVLWYIFYRILRSEYGSFIKPIIPDPVTHTDNEGVEKQ